MAKEITLEEVGETLAYIVANMVTKSELKEELSQMATKDDLADLRKEFKTDIALVRSDIQGIYEELRSIKRSVLDLYERVENVSGFREEIDHALGRIVALEKHLGVGV